MSDIVVRAARPQELAKLGELTLAAYRVDGFLDREEGSPTPRTFVTPPGAIAMANCWWPPTVPTSHSVR